MNDIQCLTGDTKSYPLDNVIPDAAYNPATDRIEIIGPGGQVIYSLSILGAATLRACISKAQTVGSMHRMKKNTEDRNDG